MVKINWSIYLILGIVTLIASYKIDSQKFRVFIWLGYLFLVIGVAKAGIWFINSKKESPVEKRDMWASFYQGIQQQSNARQMQGNSRYCPRCRLNLHGYENFCPRCGAYLRNVQQRQMGYR